MTTNGSELKNYAIIKPIHHIILGGAGKVWEALGSTILRQQWHGWLVGPRMDTGRI